MIKQEKSGKKTLKETAIPNICLGKQAFHPCLKRPMTILI